MALAVGDTNSKGEFVFPTSKEAGHPALVGRRIERGALFIQVE